MKATILDTVTGEMKTVDGPRSWEWAENDWSCDCNRNLWDVDTGKPESVCEGCERFLVVEAVMDDPEDYEYTLDELNGGYPAELRAKFLGQNATAMASPTCSPLDDLCMRMLQLGAFGGAEGGTDQMRASDIKALLVPFFGEERIARCNDIICGKANSQDSPSEGLG